MAEYGDKFYYTGGSTVLSDSNIDNLIFKQKDEINTILNTYDQTESVKMTVGVLREELKMLTDLKYRTPAKQMSLFADSEMATEPA